MNKKYKMEYTYKYPRPAVTMSDAINFYVIKYQKWINSIKIEAATYNK